MQTEPQSLKDGGMLEPSTVAGKYGSAGKTQWGGCVFNKWKNFKSRFQEDVLSRWCVLALNL